MSEGLAEGIAKTALDPDCGERFYGLRHQLDVRSFGLNQMVLEPGQRGRIHRHERQEEVFVVWDGELTVSIEGEEQTLGRGELIRIAPDVRRQLINRGGERAVFLALGGYGEHNGRDGEAFADWDQTEGAPPQQTPLPSDVDHA